MVVHIEPVPHVQAIPIERKRFVPERARREIGDELLGILPRAEIVYRMRNDDRKVIGTRVRARQQISRSLRCGIRRIGKERRVFIEAPRLIEGEIAPDLVGRDMDEFPHLRRFAQRLKKRLHSFYVGPDKIARIPMDGTVYVRLGGEVHDSVRLRHELEHQSVVGDIAFHESVPIVRRDISYVFRVCGIGEGIEVRHFHLRVPGMERPDEIRTHEPASAGHEDVSHAATIACG